MVTDPSGAVVANASVRLQNNATGVAQSTITNAQGRYQFSFLAPGSYTVSISDKGFQTAQRTLDVSVSQSTGVNVQLALATATQTIEVTAGGGGLQTQNSEITTTVHLDQIQQLPNPGNDLTNYALLSPGVTMSTQAGYGNFSTFGLPATANLFTVNGQVNNDTFFNISNSGASNLSLGFNEIGEVSVVNNAYSGQYGQLPGAQVNYVTKSGGNDFHGNALYFWDGRAMNANNFFNNQAGVPRPFVNVNMWATSLGGPVIKNKAFFFFDYEGLRSVIPTSQLTRIPSPQFSQATLQNLAATGQTQAGPFYQNMFNLYANAPGAANATPVPGGGCGSFTLLGPGVPCAMEFRSTAGNSTKEYIWGGRVDYNLSDSDRAYVRVQRDNGTQPTYTDPISPVFNTFSPQPEMQGQFGENHTFGATAVNQFILAGQYYAARFGSPDINQVLSTFPTTIRFNGGQFANMGGITYDFPQGRNITRYQIIDDLEKTWGNHTFRTGVNFHRNDMNDLNFGILTTGRITELNLMDFYNGGGTGNYLQQRFPSLNEQPLAMYQLGWYAQDEWQVKQNLKLTLSLRLDHNSNPVCQRDCFASLTTPFNQLAHDANMPYNQVIQPSLYQALPSTDAVVWQPRIGFAWSPWKNRNTVIRGGFGIFGDVLPLTIADTLARNTPQLNSFLVTNGAVTPGAANNLFTTAAQANASLIQGFSSGGTLASISATNPFFVVPGYTSTDSNVRVPRYQEWNIEVQQALPAKLLLSVNYVGNHGIFEPFQNNGLNAYCPSGPDGCGTGFAGLPTAVPDARFGIVNQIQSSGVSNYNGLTFSVRRRFANGFSFTAGYTWSHALDMVSNGGIDPFNFSTNESILNLQDPYNARLYNYGNADYDVRHNFTANYVWDDVFRHFFQWGPNALFKGWTVSGTIFAHSGFPFTVIDGNVSGALAGFNYGGNVFGTPLVSGVPSCGEPAAGGAPCLLASNFAASPDFTTTFPTGFGNQTRNQYRGPSYFNTDMTVMKNFNIPRWERGKLGIGFQFFNLFNHPNFDQPISDLADPLFGQIVSLVSAPTSILGSFVGADASPRIIQLRAQLTF